MRVHTKNHIAIKKVPSLKGMKQQHFSKSPIIQIIKKKKESEKKEIIKPLLKIKHLL
jgi:hypothetical protein